MLITLYYVNYYELLQAVLYISKKGLSKCPTLTSICAPDNSRFYRMLSLTFKTKHDINLSLQGVAMAKEKGFGVLLW